MVMMIDDDVDDGGDDDGYDYADEHILAKIWRKIEKSRFKK